MLINQKIISTGKNKLEWIIVNLNNEFIAFSDMTPPRPKRPFKVPADQIWEQIERGELEVHEHHFPPELEIPDEEIPEKYVIDRDKALDAISPLVYNDENLNRYLFGDPSGILDQLTSRSNRSKKYIATCINRYFRYGGFKNSVMPQYFNCGKNYTLPKEPKILKNNEICLKSKRGRPTKYGTPHRGITQKDIDQIERFSKKIPNGERQIIQKLYESYCKEFHTTYITVKYSDEGQPQKPIAILDKPNHLISEPSFRRQLKKFVPNIEFIRKEVGSIAYERDHKGKTGLAREGLRGAASRYEIDATVADVYIRYPFTNECNLATGRPIIFLVADTYSSMIVGVHVSFSGPNWAGASQALFNAMTDKVSFCKKYGVKIEHSDWPCDLVCREITFDRGGENTDGRMEGIIKARTGISIINMNAYHRGDMKGTVECAFKTTQEKSIRFEAGKVVKVPSKEAQHASQKAIYTYEEFMKILIRTIINRNKSQIRKDNHNFEMSRDNVGFTPLDIWNWSRENIIHRPKVSDANLRMAFLTEDKATVRGNGIYFRGLMYSSNYVIAEKWLDKAKSDGHFGIKIRYLESDTNHIWYYENKSNSIITLDLLDRSEAYKNREWASVLHQLKIVKHELSKAKYNRLNHNVMHDLSIDEIEEEIKRSGYRKNINTSKGIQPGMKQRATTEDALRQHLKNQEVIYDLSSTQLNKGELPKAKSVAHLTEQDLDDPDPIPVE